MDVEVDPPQSLYGGSWWHFRRLLMVALRKEAEMAGIRALAMRPMSPASNTSNRIPAVCALKYATDEEGKADSRVSRVTKHITVDLISLLLL